MKKKSLFLLTGLLITAFITGCGNKDTSVTADTEAAAEQSKEITGYLIDNADQYVTLGTYVDMDVEKPVYEVSEDEIYMEVQNRLYERSTVQEAERASQTGDFLDTDIIATIQGESEPSMEEEDYSIELGYQEFGLEFDEQLENCKAGDTKTFSCTYDEDFWNEDWIGKTVNFEVTVKKIEEVIIPEYNDEFVQDSMGYDTMEEFEASIKESLEADYAQQSEDETKLNALMAAMDASEFSGYPDKLYDTCKADISEKYSVYASAYGMSEEELYEMYDMTDEDVEAEILETVNRRLFISALCQKENITVTEEEYNDYLNELYVYYGYDDSASFESEYGKEALMWDVYTDKAANFLVEKSNVYEAPFTVEIEEDDYEDGDIEEIDGLGEDGELAETGSSEEAE